MCIECCANPCLALHVLHQAPVTRFEDDEEGAIEAPTASGSGHLKLIYRGLVLEDGLVFDDYEWRKERWKWSKPYAGVVWISPFFPEPKHRCVETPALSLSPL